MRNLSHRFTRFGLLMSSLVCLLLAAAVFAGAQTRQAGLWETTTRMTWIKSPMPNGAPPPGAMDGSHTSQVCLTPEMVEKYGTPLPLVRKECSISNVQKTDHGMTAEITCVGRMNGKGTIDANWVDPFHADSKAHFAGTFENGPSSKPIEWASFSSSVFRKQNCGDVKPIEPNAK
jgi:hypothetical protein